MSKKKREPVDPEHLKPEDRMKFEIAKELGLADKDRRSCDKKEERNVRENAG